MRDSLESISIKTLSGMAEYVKATLYVNETFAVHFFNGEGELYFL